MQANSTTISTMKTIAETAKHFNLPGHFVRRAVLEGKVTYVKSGSKYLINIERFAEWLCTGDQAPELSTPEPQYGQIRRTV